MLQTDRYRAISPARNSFAQNPRAGRSIIFPQALGDVRAFLPPAEGIPFPDQADHFPPHGHQKERGFRAIQVAVDLVADSAFGIKHPDP